LQVERGDMTQFSSSEPDSISTPEGDGDFGPAEPLTPDVVESSVEGMQTPRGGAPAAYDADEPSEVVEVIDEISRGKLMP
jgi:hypothetical protein